MFSSTFYPVVCFLLITLLNCEELNGCQRYEVKNLDDCESPTVCRQISTVINELNATTDFADLIDELLRLEIYDFYLNEPCHNIGDRHNTKYSLCEVDGACEHDLIDMTILEKKKVGKYKCFELETKPISCAQYMELCDTDNGKGKGKGKGQSMDIADYENMVFVKCQNVIGSSLTDMWTRSGNGVCRSYLEDEVNTDDEKLLPALCELKKECSEKDDVVQIRKLDDLKSEENLREEASGDGPDSSNEKAESFTPTVKLTDQSTSSGIAKLDTTHSAEDLDISSPSTVQQIEDNTSSFVKTIYGNTRTTGETSQSVTTPQSPTTDHPTDSDESSTIGSSILSDLDVSSPSTVQQIQDNTSSSVKTIYDNTQDSTEETSQTVTTQSPTTDGYTDSNESSTIGSSILSDLDVSSPSTVQQIQDNTSSSVKTIYHNTQDSTEETSQTVTTESPTTDVYTDSDESSTIGKSIWRKV